ncbi:MAG: hypothetical protein ABFR32_07905 [Bacteroidota bacterium]
MKYNFILIIIFINSVNIFAQIDKNNAVKINGFDFKLDTVSNKEDPKFDFNMDIPATLQLSSNARDKKNGFEFLKNQNNSSSYPSIMSQNQQNDDKDIRKPKYWNGKDVSNVRMKTSRGQELGSIETKSDKIRIECRDHSFVDGDRVRVYLNENIVYRTVTLKGNYFIINIDLKDGFNRIDIEALNQGSSGPNTAEFNVFDKKGYLISSKEWNMLTGNIATLVVIKN